MCINRYHSEVGKEVARDNEDARQERLARQSIGVRNDSRDKALSDRF